MELEYENEAAPISKKERVRVSVTVNSILGAFEEMGLSKTRQRRLIAEELAALSLRQHDFATDELWHALQHTQPGEAPVGRATVFRAVEVLVERGILDRVLFADGTHRYRLCSEQTHHHHLTCTHCHRVVEVAACLPPAVLDMIARACDFDLEGHAVELFGRCAQCRATTATAADSSPTPPDHTA